MTVVVAQARERSDIAFVFGVYALSRVVVFLVLAASLAINPDMGSDGTLAAMCRWDCIWYIELARDGYHPQAQLWASGSAANWAFFPALPMLLNAVHDIFGGDWRFVSVILMQALFFPTLLIFHAYAQEIAPPDDPNFARFATALAAAWPFSIYFAIPMSEAIFLPLSLGALLLARRDYWLAAGLVGAALSGTRVVGILIAPALLTLAVQRFGWRALLTLRPGTERVVLGLALTGLGLAGFMLYLANLTGDALGFLHIQVAWMREFKWPWMMLIDELNPLVQPWDRVALNLLLASSGVGAALLLVPLWRRRAALAPEIVLTVLVMAIAATGGRFMSLPRVLGVLFPLIFGLAFLAETPVGRRRVLIGAGAGSVLLMMILFLERTLGLWAELAM
jgi:hypothetical protein